MLPRPGHTEPLQGLELEHVSETLVHPDTFSVRQ